MIDETEPIRRYLVAQINGEVESKDEATERARLEYLYGADSVWDTDQVTKCFSIEGFMAPFCVAIRRSDNVRGVLEFQHSPRFYFDFREG